MKRSVLSKYKTVLLTSAIIAAGLFNYCFHLAMNEQDWLSWTNKCLSESYDPSGEVKLKKWELTLTSDSFIRFRKTFQRGKQEYYSFNLNRLNDMDYLSNGINTGLLKLKTVGDDIIVQTYDDPKGDIDSMTTVLNIPVKNLEPERLDSLRKALLYLKSKGL
ncbi:hypothetical protein BH09BAC6_BH09BAC6_15650 [soil metagenome]|jgi:hypothetical protein